MGVDLSGFLELVLLSPESCLSSAGFLFLCDPDKTRSAASHDHERSPRKRRPDPKKLLCSVQSAVLIFGYADVVEAQAGRLVHSRFSPTLTWVSLLPRWVDKPHLQSTRNGRRIAMAIINLPASKVRRGIPVGNCSYSGLVFRQLYFWKICLRPALGATRIPPSLSTVFPGRP